MSTSPQPESPRRRASRAQSYKIYGDDLSDFLENSPLPFGINDQLLTRLVRKIKHNENYRKTGPAEVTFIHDSDLSSGNESSSEDEYDEIDGNQDDSKSLESSEDDDVKHTKLWLMTGLHSRPTHHKNPHEFSFSLPLGEGLRRLTGPPESFKLPFNVFCPSNGAHKVLKWKSLKKNIWVEGQKKFHADKDAPSCNCKSSCDDDCLNRLLQFECNKDNCTFGTADCGNRAFANLYAAMSKDHKQYAQGYEVISAGSKGNGLRAIRSYAPHDLIVEYTGEVIDQDEVERRLNEEYTSSGSHFYFLSLEKGYSIDSGVKGSVARFANHSCDPNSEMQKWYVNGEPRIGLFAGSKAIKPSQEITYDYNFDWFPDAEPQSCYCGSTKCRGFIGKRTDPVISQSSDEETPSPISSPPRTASAPKGYAKTSVTLNLKFQAFESSGLYYFKPKSTRADFNSNSRSTSPSATPSMRNDEPYSYMSTIAKRRTRNRSMPDQYKFVEVAQCLTPALQRLLQINMAPPGQFDQTSKDMLLLNDAANSSRARSNPALRGRRAAAAAVKKEKEKLVKLNPKVSKIVEPPKVSNRSPRPKEEHNEKQEEPSMQEIAREADEQEDTIEESSIKEIARERQEDSSQDTKERQEDAQQETTREREQGTRQEDTQHEITRRTEEITRQKATKIDAAQQVETIVNEVRIKEATIREENPEKAIKETIIDEYLFERPQGHSIVETVSRKELNIRIEMYNKSGRNDKTFKAYRLGNGDENVYKSDADDREEYISKRIDTDEFQNIHTGTTKEISSRGVIFQRKKRRVRTDLLEMLEPPKKLNEIIKRRGRPRKDSYTKRENIPIKVVNKVYTERLVDKFAFVDSDEEDRPLTEGRKITKRSISPAADYSDFHNSGLSVSSGSDEKIDSIVSASSSTTSNPLISSPASSMLKKSQNNKLSPKIVSPRANKKIAPFPPSKQKLPPQPVQQSIQQPIHQSQALPIKPSDRGSIARPRKRKLPKNLAELLTTYTTDMVINKPFTDVIDEERLLTKRRNSSLDATLSARSLLDIQRGLSNISIQPPRITDHQFSDIRREKNGIRKEKKKVVLKKKSFLFDISQILPNYKGNLYK